MTALLGHANDALALLTELVVYLAAGMWGWSRPRAVLLKALAAAASVAAFVAVWSAFGAPQDPVVPLHGVARAALETVWFGAGAVAFAATGRRRAGVLLLAGWLLSALLRWVLA